MADGVAITAGSGTTVLTDDTGATGHAQVFKLAISTDGSPTLIPADAANGLDVDVTRLPAAATGTVTNVAASATSVTLKAANAARKALSIYNGGTSDLYVRLEAAAATATTGFTLKIPAGGYYELPDTPVYTGEIRGIWTATGGNGANITELT